MARYGRPVGREATPASSAPPPASASNDGGVGDLSLALEEAERHLAHVSGAVRPSVHTPASEDLEPPYSPKVRPLATPPLSHAPFSFFPPFFLVLLPCGLLFLLLFRLDFVFFVSYFVSFLASFFRSSYCSSFGFFVFFPILDPHSRTWNRPTPPRYAPPLAPPPFLPSSSFLSFFLPRSPTLWLAVVAVVSVVLT